MLHVTYRLGYLLVGPLVLGAVVFSWLHPYEVLPLAMLLLALRVAQVRWQRHMLQGWRAFVSSSYASASEEQDRDDDEKMAKAKRAWTMPTPQERTVTTRDGVKLTYYVIPGMSERVIVLAPGLGCASTFRLWGAPVLHRFADKVNYIYWDYRGLFESHGPKRIHRMSIREHAEDLHEIINAENIKQIELLLGHSMGVQVSLEFASLYPERVQKMVLCNGGHGNLLHSGLQPLFRIPMVGRLIYHFIRIVKDYVMNLSDDQLKTFVESPLIMLMRQLLRRGVQVYSVLFGSQLLRDVLGPTYMEDFYEEYIIEGASTRHVVNYVRLIMELDAHSVYHLLPEIQHPILLISGLFDPVTPAYHFFEMAELLPNCHHVVSTYSAHVTLLEEPAVAMREIEKFFHESVPNLKYKRRSSIVFEN